MESPVALDPDNLPDGSSEYGWGAGMFQPGIANGEGQRRQQDDFGANMYPPQDRMKNGAENDNYARAVADRRTDATDPDSGRDFETAGNPDRYGAAPELVQATPEPNVNRRYEPPLARLHRRR